MGFDASNALWCSVLLVVLRLYCAVLWCGSTQGGALGGLYVVWCCVVWSSVEWNEYCNVNDVRFDLLFFCCFDFFFSFWVSMSIYKFFLLSLSQSSSNIGKYCKTLAICIRFLINAVHFKMYTIKSWNWKYNYFRCQLKVIISFLNILFYVQSDTCTDINTISYQVNK